MKNIEKKLIYIKKYGSSSISYSTLQTGLSDFIVDGIGYLSYVKYLNSNFILGDPICDQQNRALLLSQAIKELKKPSFLQINQSTSNILHDEFGYKINQMGIETKLNIQEYQLLNDLKKRNLRSFIRKGQEQAAVYELTKDERESKFNIKEDDLHYVTKEWFKGRTARKTLKFLIRDTIYDDEKYVRKFFSIDKNNKLLGFVFFNPIFRDDMVVGYTADMMRALTSASKGHVAYIVMTAFEKFKNEALETLSLGLSPCYGIEKMNGYKYSKVTHLSVRFLYHYGNRFYNFKGLAENKKQYRGIEDKVYFAVKKSLPLVEIMKINNYIGIL